MRQTELFKQIVTPTKTNLNTKKVHVMKQGALKRKMLKGLIVGKRRIFNYLSVVGKVTMKI